MKFRLFLRLTDTLEKVTWVDLFAHWKYQYRPVRKVISFLQVRSPSSSLVFQLMFMIIELLIGIGVGFIPCKHLHSE